MAMTTKEELIEAFVNPVLNEALKKKDPINLYLKGLVGSGISLVTAALFKETKNPMLLVVNDREEGAYLFNDLENLVGENRVFFFPGSSRLPYQTERTDNANVLQRAELLSRLSDTEKHVIVVTYPEALGEKVATRKQLKQNTLEIKVGNDLGLEFINELLFEYHFERVDFVSKPGEFSIRGGIVDIFSYSNDYPYRIELFGDEVDSIRTFDPATQLSQAQLKRIRIVPNIQDGELLETRENFIEFLPKHTAVFLKDESFLKDKIKTEYERAEKNYAELKGEVKHLPPAELYTQPQEMEQLLFGRLVLEFGMKAHRTIAETVEYKQAPQPEFNKNFELLSANLKDNVDKDFNNLIAASSARQIERLHSIFEDLEKEQHFTPLLLPLHQGFVDHERKLACYTDHQIFERYHRFRLKEGFKDSQQQISLKELTQLQKGDYVTHVDHGVGQFAGLTRVETNGEMQEAIKLTYKDGDVLFVSIHSLHRISKYSGKEGVEPKINKLGTQAWKNLKNKTKKKIKEIAYDLIKLYAKRKAVQGFAFSPDTFLQNELEASFIYEDTPDQEKATAAVKADMESDSPMDRLICGDVGFGKTEVAMRAAFKAATDGKQVAVLVPTTILALQHYKSFSERLKDFPVKVEYINRFRSSKKVKEVLQELKEGKVNIIIGTHRIVGKDVKFHDLGLLIIDEEQKFGVGVKDKLKTMRENVDTLTLTATPIPRTLQFSLMGARDLSVINTPPPNRQPVETELHTFNEEIIRDAINYEMARDGQVFMINNRVQNIQEVAGMIQRLVPDARVITAHGQLDGKELEDRMLRFIDGEGDVLVATTIIESGLDIPNANTIIINNAHQFGLSDLHQMRGRVGRSNKKAFCHLLAPPLSVMTPEARKRMTAITQFSDLGSGFNIAMRDLDIRGAGNLLGGEQSGFINEIGFDMYKKILDEAMQELKENEFKDLFQDEKPVFVEDTQIETDLEINIPHDYVNNVTERLALYQELSGSTTAGQLEKFKLSLQDRFGPLPNPTERLIRSMELKWLGTEIGFEKLVLKSGKMLAYFIQDQQSPYFETEEFGKVLGYMQNPSNRCVLKDRNGKLYLVMADVASIEEGILRLLQIKAAEPASLGV